MCYLCSGRSKAWSFEARLLSPDAFPADGVGDRLIIPAAQDPAEVLVVGLVTDPDIPNDASTSAGVTVGGPSLISTINTPGDQDWIRVELQAGVTYEIALNSTRNGPSGVPLTDPLVELYNANGLFEGMDDSGGPSSPNGTDDALLFFRPTESGVYYINARAWDARDPFGLGIDPNPLTTTGDFVGDYEVYVRVSNLIFPYYPIDFETEDDPSTARNEIGLPTLDSSPLSAIDWGGRIVNKINQSVRNPDGEEGPRETGNPQETPTGPYTIDHPGKNVITVYFAKAGELYVDDDPLSPGTTDTIVSKGFEAWEIAAYTEAFAAYSKVADIVYVVIDNVYDPLTLQTAADFTFIVYEGTTGSGIPGVVGTPSLLGRMSPPDEDNEGQSEFNGNDIRWTPEGLAPGGFSFNTLIHEMGHGHGLAHPHDTGGGSSIMRGVFEESLFNYSRGDFDLNQGVHTMMSYEDGWETSPYGQASSTDPFGWAGSLMAFDVAVIQDKYGVNEEWATGDDTYVLKDVNAPGTFYSCIWDAGGTDAISYGGARDCTIDLRPATLKYEPGGGGWMSYAFGIHGGYTIANAVIIENAKSGSGKDALTGNDAANTLDAGAGDDILSGRGGNDILIGGAGKDTLDGGAGSDLFLIGAGDSGIGVFRDVIKGFEQGSDKIDLTGTGASRFIATADFSGVAGQVRFVAIAGTAVIEVDTNGDRLTDFQIEIDSGLQLTLDDFVGLGDANGATNGDDVLNGTAGNDVLRGYGGNDVINGHGGIDLLVGGAGADRLTGGGGADVFGYQSLTDSHAAAFDTITDFTRRSDRIDLSEIDANAGTSANEAFSFIGKSAFSGQAGQVRFASMNGGTMIQADVNGDAIADFQIFLDDKVTLTSSDFVL
jgi:serralysin